MDHLGQDQEPRTPQSDPPTSRGLAWPAVALALVVVLGLVLGAALWADRSLRPSVAQPAPATAVRPVVIVAIPTPAPTTPPAVSAPATGIPTAVPTVGATPTPQPAEAVPAPTSATAWWTWSNEVSPEVQAQLGEVYFNYWKVVAEAYYTLDESRLPEVEAGEELEGDQKAVRDLRSQSRAQRLIIDHKAQVLFVSDFEAVIYDEFTSNSVFLDPTTKEEFATDEPPLVQRIVFYLQRIDDKWKVLDGVRVG